MATITALGDGLHCIDLEFQGQPGVIASYLVEDAGERALVEVGPSSTLDTLLGALRELKVEPESIGKLLVTHIHLDHAGASGSFMRRFRQAQLFVHQVGAPHLIDPEKLLASAARIYGNMMGPLWGEVVAVPEERVTMLEDGDVVTVGGKQLATVYTPGHAAHHVVYHDAERGSIFAGDVAAVRLQGFDYVRPPTPPPELDLELWLQSIERVRALQPRRLYLTHFGPFDDTDHHLNQARERLTGWAEVVEKALTSGQDRPAIVDNLMLHGNAEILTMTNDAAALERYELASPYGMSVDGYLRYFRKRAKGTAER